MEKRFKSLKKISNQDAEKYISAEEDFNNNFLCFYTLNPSNDSTYSAEEGWDEVKYYTIRRKPKINFVDKEFITNEGYVQIGKGSNTVYIMSNESMPGLLKIGSTRKHIEERRKQLSSVSGVPVPFKIECVFKLDGNEEQLENEIHRYLEHKRNSMQREFFDISLQEAIDIIKKIGKNYT